MILHVVKSLVGVDALGALSLVGIVVRRTRSDVRLVDGLMRRSFVGHPIIPEENQTIVTS